MNSLLQSVKSSLSFHSRIPNNTVFVVRSSSVFVAKCYGSNHIDMLKILPTKTVCRSVGHYFVHPEKMKQIVKERDAQAMCNYFASEKYRRKIQEVVEMQKRMLFDELPEGIPAKEIRFEHIINCAQPTPITGEHNEDVLSDDDEDSVPVLPQHKKKIIKTTIMSVMLKKRKAELEESGPKFREPPVLPVVIGQTKKILDRKNKFRKKSTILPIFLKKIQDKALKQKSHDRINDCLTNESNNMETEAKGSFAETSGFDTGGKGFTPSASHYRKTAHEFYRRYSDHPEQKLTKMQSGPPIELVECKRNNKYPKYKKLRPKPKSKKKETRNSNTEWNLPVNRQYYIDDNLSNVIQTRHLYREPKVSALFNSVKTGNVYKSDTLDSEKHLIRLPTLTPEGYRVVLYSVKDSDPTKLNFSDAIKVFCMYNDCVLSEDGLEEGYIVIFDMHDVQLGHLARVSLPALRCFMLYIQEAHPVRLKAVHVLNTASWIHHVMRLVIPLVKSEVLNMVKFHRGNAPDNFPIEILPNEYGGRAGSVDDFDVQTNALMKKYEPWLLESSELISDESKRPKKASWWGLWSGSSKATNNGELDEKTILKNLQID